VLEGLLFEVEDRHRRARVCGRLGDGEPDAPSATRYYDLAPVQTKVLFLSVMARSFLVAGLC